MGKGAQQEENLIIWKWWETGKPGLLFIPCYSSLSIELWKLVIIIMIYVRKHQKNLTRGARRCLYLKLQKWANNPREVQESFIHLHVFSSCCSHWRYKIRQVLLSLIPCSMEERGTRKGLDVRSGTHNSHKKNRAAQVRKWRQRIFREGGQQTCLQNCPWMSDGSKHSEEVSKTDTWKIVLETEKITASEVLK